MGSRQTIFDSMPPSSESYDPSYFASLLSIEDRHFWFCSRNRVIAALVRQIIPTLPPDYRVLEVGCGNGNVLRFLEQVCRLGGVMGMDLFIEGLRFARDRVNCALVQGDINAPPFEMPFNLLCCFDVLEHLPDDVRVLKDLHSMLAENGVLLLTVPAHMSLWSYFDEASHHCRRYGLEELETKLVAAGYQVEYTTYFMVGILPLIWAGRRLAGLRARRQGQGETDVDQLASGELRIFPVINSFLSRLLAPEAGMIAGRRRLPFGTSLLALVRKSPVLPT